MCKSCKVLDVCGVKCIVEDCLNCPLIETNGSKDDCARKTNYDDITCEDLE